MKINRRALKTDAKAALRGAKPKAIWMTLLYLLLIILTQLKKSFGQRTGLFTHRQQLSRHRWHKGTLFYSKRETVTG